jgi:hypothetical protein
MTASRLPLPTEIFHDASPAMHSEILQASIECIASKVQYDSDCEATEYYQESDFDNVESNRRKSTYSELWDSDTTIPFHESLSFELAGSVQRNESCNIYPVKLANQDQAGKQPLSSDTHESVYSALKSTIRKRLPQKRRQASVPGRILHKSAMCRLATSL